MLMLFAEGVSGLVEPVMDSINWSKLGSAGAVASATLAVAVPLARWYAKLHAGDLGAQLVNAKAELKIEKDGRAADAQNADGRVRVAETELNAERQKQHALQLANVGLTKTVDAQAEAARQADAKVAERDTKIAEREVKVAELRGRLANYDQALKDARAKGENLVREVEAERKSVADLKLRVATATSDKETLTWELNERIRHLSQSEKRMKQATALNGHLWQAEAAQSVPAFRPRPERMLAVVALLNLKGGVGKTTITANLGAALARRGKRVLLVDLDLQGSLSSLMLSQDAIGKQFHGKRLLQDYFRAASEGDVPPLRDFVTPAEVSVAAPGRLDVVATTDQLAYAELNLNMNWLLKQGERDVRFLLRAGVHEPALCKEYDVVLLDCPPLLNVSCVNALAAADLLVIPTLPSRKAMERIPRLVEMIQAPEFKANVSKELGILGVIANRTSRADLTDDESREWKLQTAQIKKSVGWDMNRLPAVVPQRKEVQESEGAFKHPADDSVLGRVFAVLAEVIEKEIPSERPVTQPVSRKPGGLSSGLWG